MDSLMGAATESEMDMYASSAAVTLSSDERVAIMKWELLGLGESTLWEGGPPSIHCGCPAVRQNRVKRKTAKQVTKVFICQEKRKGHFLKLYPSHLRYVLCIMC